MPEKFDRPDQFWGDHFFRDRPNFLTISYRCTYKVTESRQIVCHANCGVFEILHHHLNPPQQHISNRFCHWHSGTALQHIYINMYSFTWAFVHPSSVAYPYTSSGMFGAGSGPIFLSGLECLGTEQTLLDCSTSNHPYSYSHAYDAGVQCAHRQYSGEIFAVIIVLMNRCIYFGKRR